MATKKVKAGATAAKKTAVRSAASVEAPVSSSKSETTATTKVNTVRAIDVPRKSALRSTLLDGGKRPLVTALIAELLGTFLLASIVIVTKGEPLYLLFGLTGIVLTMGVISGAHFNPLLTVAAWITRKISGVRALCYVVAQIIGALLAFVVLTAFIKAAPAVSEQAALYGQTAPSLFSAAALTAGKEWYVFFAELIGGIVFSFAVAAAMRITKDHLTKAFTYGIGLFVAVLIAGIAASYGSANAVVNPAIAFAVNAVHGPWMTGGWWSIAIYIFAPIVGGVLGFALHDLLNAVSDDDKTVARTI